MKRKIYLPYKPSGEKLDYLPLLYLHKVAEYNKEKRVYNTIHFRSLQDLADRINEGRVEKNKLVSVSTLSRLLNGKKYESFFTYNKEEKTIILQNDFHNGTRTAKAGFVVLSANEFDFLLERNESLLVAYVLYLKYSCGISKSKTTDSTAKQILSACGYCATSGNYLSKLSEYNKLLAEQGFLSIETKRDEQKHLRNTYKII